MSAKPGQTIVVWFSCGAASAIAVQETLRQYPDCTVRVVNSPIAEEDEDNQRFARDVAEWLGIEIETAINEKYPNASAVEVWERRQYMAGVAGAPCTLELKKEARRQWESRNHHDWHVLGFTLDEKHRFDRFVTTERDNVLPVLIDAGLTKPDCLMRIVQAGIKLPLMYRLGYANANCKMCPKATSPTYYNKMRRDFPNDFKQRAEQAKRLGVKPVRLNGKRIALHELPPDAEGAPLKSMQSECGIFCEEQG